MRKVHLAKYVTFPPVNVLTAYIIRDKFTTTKELFISRFSSAA